MRKADTERINLLLERYPNDEELKRLIENYKYEVDDKGERDEFFADKTEDYLNNMSVNTDKFVRRIATHMHRYLQNEFIKLIVKIIDVLGQPNYDLVDGRNEWGIKIMKKLRKFCVDELIIYHPKVYTDIFGNEVENN